jgi:hypothetical protein
MTMDAKSETKIARKAWSKWFWACISRARLDFMKKSSWKIGFDAPLKIIFVCFRDAFNR